MDGYHAIFIALEEAGARGPLSLLSSSDKAGLGVIGQSWGRYKKIDD